MGRKPVLEYFRAKAPEYDDVDSQIYWQLSDHLLWKSLTEDIFPSLDGDTHTILDAGGGTGRWIIRILDEFTTYSGVLFDISPDMLAEARAKINSSAELRNRIALVQGDLHQVHRTLDKQFNLIICFHNVLGFVSDPEVVVENLVQLLRPRGKIVLFVPNLYHGVFFNTKLNRVNEATKIAETARGTFTPDMPDMHFFTPNGIKDLLKDAGLSHEYTRGFPITIYPDVEETQLSGNTASISEILEDGDNYEQILETEWNLSHSTETAARGNNLLAVAHRE